MTARHRTPLTLAAALIATTALVGCTVVQDTFQVGAREFFFATAAEAQDSRDSFRFQGFLPDDATDVRLLAQLDGHAAVMRWESPTAFASEHCDEAPVTSEPPFDPEWSLDSLPDEGFACLSWTVVRSGQTQLAWSDPDED